jgi:acetyltransferase-like isoleucine patch superfamily enzyme
MKLLVKLWKKSVMDAKVSKNSKLFNSVRIYIGKKCDAFEIEDRVQVRRLVDLEVGGSFKVGSGSVIGVGSFIQADGEVEIGQGVLLGPGVKIFSTSHEYGRGGELHKPLVKGKVKVSNNVWLGCNSVIAMNVNIGENSVIGANSFVNRDVPANTVVVGNPARIVKEF